MPTLTCEHCESEIDVAKDPRCVFYDPSGATDVICEGCRERVALGPHPDQPEGQHGAVYHFDERGHIIDDAKEVEKPAAATFRAAE